MVVLEQKEPDGQAVHELLPAVVWYWPDEQAVHEVCGPELAVNWPAGQLTQPDAAIYSPALHEHE